MIMSDVLLHTFIVTQMSSKEQLTFFPVINNVTVLFSLNVCIHTDVFLYWMKCKCDNMTTATGVENLVLYVLLSSVLSRSSLADSTHFMQASSRSSIVENSPGGLTNVLKC